MERRTFMAGGAAAVAAAATACKATNGSAGASASATGDSKVPLTTTSVAAPANWAALARGLDGALVRPGEASWAAARQLYNTRFDNLKPAAVAYVAHADDIRTVLAYARAHRIKAAIRNGGHSYGGWSSGDGRLIIDVSKLNRVRASGSSAVVGAGSKLIDVYRALAAKGVTIPAGSCPTVGVSGLVLGGGHGVVSRAYGLTCDSLTRATLITADGKQLTADATTNKDLFWALRGAGNGNFGVVTELEFRTHPAPQAVTGYLTWPWSRAAAVVKAWQEWGPSQPDEIWSSLHVSNATGGTPTVSVAAFCIGTYGQLQNAVDRLADRVGAPRRTSRCAAVRTRRRWRSTQAARPSPPTPSATCRAPRPAAPRRARSAARRTRPARTSSTSRSRPRASRPC